MQTQTENNVTVLPYRGPRKQRPHSQFAVHAPIEGLEVKIGRSVASVSAALRRAAKLSESHGYAIVVDNSRSINERMVALYKRGVEKFVSDSVAN